MNFGLNLRNRVFGRMFGFIVILFMTPSGHSWIINKIRIPIGKKILGFRNIQEKLEKYALAQQKKPRKRVV